MLKLVNSDNIPFNRFILMYISSAKLRSEVMKDIVAVDVPTNTRGCASCYGAETEERPCCPTCEDVRLAYKGKGWSFSSAKNIAQVITLHSPRNEL